MICFFVQRDWLLGVVHREMVSKFVETGQSSSIGQVQSIFGLHKKGYIFPTKTLKGLNLSKSTELSFIAAVRRLKTPRNIVYCYNSGSVDAFGLDAMLLFHFPIDLKADFSLFSLCPELETVFKCVLIKKVEEQLGRKFLKKIQKRKVQNDASLEFQKEKAPLAAEMRKAKETLTPKLKISKIEELILTGIDPDDEKVKEIYEIFTNEAETRNVLLFDVPDNQEDFKKPIKITKNVNKRPFTAYDKKPIKVVFSDLVLNQTDYIHAIGVSSGEMTIPSYLRVLLSIHEVNSKFGLHFNSKGLAPETTGNFEMKNKKNSISSFGGDSKPKRKLETFKTLKAFKNEQTINDSIVELSFPIPEEVFGLQGALDKSLSMTSDDIEEDKFDFWLMRLEVAEQKANDRKLLGRSKRPGDQETKRENGLEQEDLFDQMEDEMEDFDCLSIIETQLETQEPGSVVGSASARSSTRKNTRKKIRKFIEEALKEKFPAHLPLVNVIATGFLGLLFLSSLIGVSFSLILDM